LGTLVQFVATVANLVRRMSLAILCALFRLAAALRSAFAFVAGGAT
jgi:hypothetical protein